MIMFSIILFKTYLLTIQNLVLDVYFLCSKHPNLIEQDDWDEMEMQKMEEARKTYIAAVVAGKEKQDEESMATVVNSRLQLESILFKPT